MIRGYACLRDGRIVNVIVIDEPDELPDGAHPSGLEVDHPAITEHEQLVPLDSLNAPEGHNIGIGWQLNGDEPMLPPVDPLNPWLGPDDV